MTTTTNAAQLISAYLETNIHRYNLKNSVSIKILAMDLQELLASEEA